MIVRPPRRRHGRPANRLLPFIGVSAAVLVVGFGAWWLWPDSQTDANDQQGAAVAPPARTEAPDPPPIATPVANNTDTEEQTAWTPPRSEGTTLVPADEPDDPPAPQPVEDAGEHRAANNVRSGNAAIESARRLYEAGNILEARTALNNLLTKNLPEPAAVEARSMLTRIADEVIFGRRTLPNDPHAELYTIQDGDRLANLAPPYAIPHQLIMQVNGIKDARRIRVGQRIKIPRGPFHVKIDKSDFRLDLYLGELYVRSYRVGLGQDNGTPEGVWRIKNRLENPTYFPPASATTKRIIPPGDPTNPLGSHWIGLEGVEGDAVGQQSYGIHGTIEPESIGRAVSAGCIRMHNVDVEFLFKVLIPGKSMVTITP